jgi:threonine/homoserine/homoserine lactone efflux protein
VNDTLSLLANAIGLGIFYAALPGVVVAEAVRRGIAGGARRAFTVLASGLLGAAFWAGLALFGAALIADNRAFTVALTVVGVAFLAWLAISAARAAIRPPAVDPHALPSARGDVATGLVAGVANPAGLPFWAGIASSAIAGQEAGADTGRATLFVAGVLLGSLLYATFFSSLIGWGRRFLRPGFFRGVNAVCAAAFLLFAAQMLWALR